MDAPSADFVREAPATAPGHRTCRTPRAPRSGRTPRHRGDSRPGCGEEREGSRDASISRGRVPHPPVASAPAPAGGRVRRQGECRTPLRRCTPADGAPAAPPEAKREHRARAPSEGARAFPAGRPRQPAPSPVGTDPVWPASRALTRRGGTEAPRCRPTRRSSVRVAADPDSVGLRRNSDPRGRIARYSVAGRDDRRTTPLPTDHGELTCPRIRAQIGAWWAQGC
jgi:hypothetical protein